MRTNLRTYTLNIKTNFHIPNTLCIANCRTKTPQKSKSKCLQSNFENKLSILMAFWVLK